MGYLKDIKSGKRKKPDKILVTLRRNSDGAQAVYEDQHAKLEDDHWQFCWFAHNHSCDCNRGSYFAESAGEPDPDHDCSESKYSVIRVETPDGKVLFEGDDRVENPYYGKVS
ncbi:MAG: hypothetical protein JJ916_04255 [Phycisphaerales bacterium]|nr:hypothetical protein [Phycisphaerales bacterium]